jgi:hypothetical protein
MKYLITICGEKYEKCNFNNLLKPNNDPNKQELEELIRNVIKKETKNQKNNFYFFNFKEKSK